MKIAAALAVLVLVAPAAASERHPTLNELENEIICPVCKPETLAQSDAPVAQRMKQQISRWIAQGDTKSQIENKLVANFGESVLAAPPKKGFNLLVWWLPIAGVVAGAAVLSALAWRWSRSREPAPAAPGAPHLDPELEQRVDQELARFDG
ncbi:MAG: cytochrome c-type biogenesis protein [Gaiellaceae bacterium]